MVTSRAEKQVNTLQSGNLASRLSLLEIESVTPVQVLGETLRFSMCKWPWEMLYIDLRLRQTCHSKDGGSTYSIGVGELGWQYGTGLKSHGTVTNWCTGREWPMNCMTVISARWRSNMPFQRRRKCIRDWVDVELLYNSVKTGSQLIWESEELEIWCCGKNSTQQIAGPPGLRLSKTWRTGKKRW